MSCFSKLHFLTVKIHTCPHLDQPPLFFLLRRHPFFFYSVSNFLARRRPAVILVRTHSPKRRHYNAIPEKYHEPRRRLLSPQRRRQPSPRQERQGKVHRCEGTPECLRHSDCRCKSATTDDAQFHCRRQGNDAHGNQPKINTSGSVDAASPQGR